MKYRYENFGGIISSESPPFLAFVDRTYMRELGLKESSLWDTDDEEIGLLTAPVEVHFAITNKCSMGCPHCYMEAGKEEDHELDTHAFKKALDILAGINVFHIALGGGEALERPDLIEIAEYARAKGIVPNLTVSGLHITSRVARKMKVFGQVNISMDGAMGKYDVFRGKKMFEMADNAIDILVSAGIPTGINCVVGKRNYDEIPQLFAYATKKKLNEIEFLRFKPSGRGRKLYDEEHTTDDQNKSITPMLAGLSSQYGITAKIDCSFVPMLCYHNPSPELLEAMATYGCEAGNVLLGIRSDGRVSGCSFLESPDISVFDLDDPSKRKDSFKNVYTWTKRAPEPCRSCEYLDICKGGCHGVAEYVTGDFDSPDPECPFVVEYNNNGNSR